MVALWTRRDIDATRGDTDATPRQSEPNRCYGGGRGFRFQNRLHTHPAGGDCEDTLLNFTCRTGCLGRAISKVATKLSLLVVPRMSRLRLVAVPLAHTEGMYLTLPHLETCVCICKVCFSNRLTNESFQIHEHCESEGKLLYFVVSVQDLPLPQRSRLVHIQF